MSAPTRSPSPSLDAPASSSRSGHSRPRASSWWEFFTHSPPSSPPKSDASTFARGHYRTPSVPIPSIQINSPSENPSTANVTLTTSLEEGDIIKPRKNPRRLERSVSSFGGYECGESSTSNYSIAEESPKDSSSGQENTSDAAEPDNQCLITKSEEVLVLQDDDNSSDTSSKKWSPKHLFLHPMSLQKKGMLAPPKRQRSKSYSDLYAKGGNNNNAAQNENLLPELTLEEVKEILIRHKLNKPCSKKNTAEITKSPETSPTAEIPPPPTPPPMPASPPMGVVSALLPAASLASLDGRLLTGIKNLKSPKNSPKGDSPAQFPGLVFDARPHTGLIEASSTSGRGGVGGRAARPRMLSSPTCLIPDNIHTAPVLMQGHHYSSALNFFRPYFRRASQLSAQGLILAESMVSLTNRALVSFIVEDNYSGLHHLLESRRVAVDDRDENGSTALMVATAKGKLNFVRALLEHGADINAEDVDNWTPLLFAAREGFDEIVADLIDHGAGLDHKDIGGWTPLMWACYKGRTKSAKLLIEKGADVNMYGSYSVTCLGWAAGRGHTEIVKDLLARGAKVNVGDKYGTTPLIWAARKGYIEIVDMLLNLEANVDACGMTSWTPLLVAAAGNHVEVVKAILEHKPNVNALDKDGCSALTIASKSGFHEIAVSLINHGAYININDRGGTSNLIHAAKGGHRSIVEALLKKHADVNMQGKDRKTALYWSVEKSHIPVVKLILSCQPDLEVSTKDGDSPLMKAVRNRNIDIVSLLLDKRAKVSVADKNGDTCLHIAMRARSKQIVELLLRNPAHSQLLYRPNRAGETPYNIDRASPKPIIPQIFGSRGLNTQEDGENLLGYNLYSSALADMLSDPTLNMPITVGLFARWGSGKSFLLGKLREEMKSFARQWLNPIFSWNVLILIIVLCFASVVGVIAGLALQNWIVGVGFAAGVTFFVHAFLFCVWFSSRRSKYDWSWSNRMSSYLATKSEALQLVCQVIFCHPPGAQSADQLQAQPINFYFTDQTKISSTTGGENSVVQMLGSLYTCIENDYGVMSSRLYRAFRPTPVAATADWKWRKLCCIPYCVIFLFCFVCTLVAIVVLALHLTGMGPEGYTTSLSVVMYVCALIVGLLLVANLYTVGQVLKAVVFSHRRHLQRTVSKLYTIKAEGFLNALKAEVNLMTDMIHCLDAFQSRQTRMVVIVDGLDSAEQEKVLQVLDAVHILFSDVKAPFVILLAIDPHIITKGIEMNINPVLNESNIGGHEFLRNLVHLPFFLQNAALRKVKHVKMLESSMKRNSRLEDDPGPKIILSTRRPSVESGFGIPLGLDTKFEKASSKKPKRLGLKMSESIASSLGSNLNKVTSGMPIIGGPSDLKKMLLGDDYFSDVNPRSMRRLMNIIHITGRLLKCFSIDFNWYHLSAWVNVTEQWPYRLSWIIIYCEHFQKDLDDGMSLKSVYERVRQFVPTSKDVDANVTLDRDEKKLGIYLGMHKGSLLVSTLYVFLPFTISLDPQLRKDITEQYQPVDQLFKSTTNLQQPAPDQPSHGSFLQPQPQYGQGAGGGHPPPQPSPALRYRGGPQRQPNQPGLAMPNGYPPQLFPGFPNMAYQQNMWYPPGMPQQMYMGGQLGAPPAIPDSSSSIIDPILARDLRSKKLSSMAVEGVCDLLIALTGIKSSQLTKYQETVRRNNINGRVLLSCDLQELKLVLQMTFGDWEMFKAAVVLLRDSEHKNIFQDKSNDDNVANNNQGGKDMVRISVTSPGSPIDRGQVNKSPIDIVDSKKPPTGQQQQQQQQLRPNVLEKQVTMEELMICGALEGLNDEARDDARAGEGEDSSCTLSPINSEPEPQQYERRKSSKAYLSQDETDVLYVMGTSSNITAELPDSPSIVRKLSEAEAKFSVVNESLHHVIHANNSGHFGSVAATSEPICIPGAAKSPSRRNRATPNSSLSKNLSFSESVTMCGSSPIKSRSLGAKDYNSKLHQHQQRSSKSPAKERKVSRSFAAQMERPEHSSSDASSDESQTPLVMKPIPSSDKHRKPIPVIRPASSRHQSSEPASGSQSPKKKRIQRDDSIASKLSRIRSTLFGQSQDSPPAVPAATSQFQQQQYHHPQQQQQNQHHVDPHNIPCSSQFRNEYHSHPVRYDFPTEDSSEPSQYFKDHGHHWTAYRAPTPLPPFGSDEYYQVIKSSNPSPTTSNESELGSTPEHISSKEELFLPGPPPDLPESPYPIRGREQIQTQPSSSINNNTGGGTTGNNMGGGSSKTKSMVPTSRSFVPVSKPPQSQPINNNSEEGGRPIRKLSRKGRTVASSGEEAVICHSANSSTRRLRRRTLNQSDPVLSNSSSRGDNIHQQTSPHHVVDMELVPMISQQSSSSKHENRPHNEESPMMGSPPLTRQEAISSELESSRENTPQQ
ncbi:kinase D-interacting substrate of 220 kDa B isoform X2 [Folsomia candida]|uniref:kinase D-interacting substrate of 220 kDa B isoform X2 n=1 Tax=Folsomia candida TaxID=158441 RepID=UPI001604C550|nr:kinase D-interacting substrate of 220 kDa B isoform X2 [Folsomia candida]